MEPSLFCPNELKRVKQLNQEIQTSVSTTPESITPQNIGRNFLFQLLVAEKTEKLKLN